MMVSKRILLWVFLSVFTALANAAVPISDNEIPEILKPWVPWVLYGQEQQQCPFLYNDGASRECLWPARLQLTLDATGGQFSQTWRVFARAWAALPGDARHWPQDVLADGQPATVSARNGVPGVVLEPGLHTLSGAFQWDALPEALPIPAATGLLELSVNAAPVAFPDLDNGTLWLQRTLTEGVGEERLELQVQRLVSDSIPLELATHITLDVSGKSREVLLGRALPENFIPLALNGSLPVRLEADGRLRVQVRPGHWTLELLARHQGPVSKLSAIEAEGPWADEEIWAFQAHNELRLVTLEGVAPIDPQQTNLPDAWKRFPAYRLHAGDTLSFVEKKRGDPEPAPDQLSLHRVWWLDFDGGGYAVQDHINGTLNRSWRLEMNAPLQLGRVAVDGQEQYITRLAENTRAGVEVRRGNVQISADSRVEKPGGTLAAVGWEQDFSQVSGVLNLPPGWRLFHASGVDHIPATWIKKWTLLDVFLVLIIALSIGKLWNWRWGGLALITLTLLYHEAGAPLWVWLNILAAVALLRVLPSGRAHQVVEWYRRAALVVLVLITLPFMVTQVRQGLFPTLEQPWTVIGGDELRTAQLTETAVMDQNVMQDKMEFDRGDVSESAALPAPASGGISGGSMPEEEKRPYSPFKRKLALDQIDPKAQIQTGPGLPHWQWHIINMNWSGPVERGQQIQLWLIPPWANFMLALLRVILLALLVLCVLGIRLPRWPDIFTRLPRFQTATPVLLFALVLLSAPDNTHAETTPSPELLQALQQRLLVAPECLPECAQSPRLALEISGSQLHLRMDVHASEDTAIPLPGQTQQWLPQQVWLDGIQTNPLLRKTDGTLWLQVAKGNHQLQLEGLLPARESVQLALPLRPHRVDVLQTQDWSVAGLHEDGQADANLELTRTLDAATADETLETDALPPFVRVERTLLLGLTWQVDTRVVRMSPLGSAVLIEVPLLNGESVTTPDVRVENGKVRVNLAAQQTEMSWTSVLKQQEALQLTAPQSVPWVEVWRADVSPIWHVKLDGIPVIHHQDQGGQRLPEWRPWPGETVNIQVTRPEGVPGQTLTLDRSLLKVAPGLRATDVTLALSLRSSQGGQHRVQLPAGAELQSVTINGQTQPIRQEGVTVTLPLTPGTQQAQLTWRETRGIVAHFLTPLVNVGSASVNTHIEVNIPDERWILLLDGPRLGPAVLFWGVLLVILLVAAGLGRVPFTPLKTWQWILLGLGLSQVPVWVAALVAGWLLTLGWRARAARAEDTPQLFNFYQIVLAVWTLFALISLIFAVNIGLLGQPDMQITGNGSHNGMLHWYQDRSSETLPQAWVLSVPLMVYRLLMLAWALWLAYALLGWLRWGWSCFSKDGLWRRLKLKKPVRTPEANKPSA
jgi:hypothetical protein